MTLTALPGYLAQLRSYDEGSRLKRAAMDEVKDVLKQLRVSRRAFVRDAQRMGVDIPSFQSLSYWIGCVHIPTPENVDRLTEALELLMRNRGASADPWHESLRESSYIHDHTLHKFRLDAQNLERAKELCDSILAVLTTLELPPVAGATAGSFIPLTREHGIQCLNILRRIHFDAAENATGARAVEHELIAAKASIELAHQLNISGRHVLALEAADEGSYTLESILEQYPGWRDMPVEAYRQSVNTIVTLTDMSFLALTRKATALHGMGQLADTPRERDNFRQMVDRTLSQAIVYTQRLSADSVLKPAAWHTWTTFGLDNAVTRQDLQQAADTAKSATEFSRAASNQSLALLAQQYVIYMLGVEAHARLHQLPQAAELLQEGERLEEHLTNQFQRPVAPSQRVVNWRALAAYWMAHAERENKGSTGWREYSRRWRDAISAGMQLAQSTGMLNQARRVRLAIRRAAPQYRDLLDPQVRGEEA